MKKISQFSDKKRAKNFGTILETESSNEESISLLTDKKADIQQNYSSFESNQTEILESQQEQNQRYDTISSDNQENDENTENNKKRQKNNFQCFIQLCLVIFGLMLISFSVTFNRPNLTVIEPVGIQIPIFSMLGHFFSLCGILITKNMYYKEGLRKCQIILAFMLFIQVIINVLYDFVICPKICSENVLSLNQRNACMFIYVVLFARSLFEGMCYSVGVILLGIMIKKIADNSKLSILKLVPFYQFCFILPFIVKYTAFQFLQSYISIELKTYIVSLSLSAVGLVLIFLFQEKRILGMDINIYKNNPSEEYTIKQMFQNCLNDSTLYKWLIFTVLQTLILGYYEISHKFIIMNNIPDQFEDDEQNFMKKMVDSFENSMLVSMWSMVAASIVCMIYMNKKNIFSFTIIVFLIVQLQLLLTVFAVFSQSQFLLLVLSSMYGVGTRVFWIIYYTVCLLVYKGDIQYFVVLRTAQQLSCWFISMLSYFLFMFYDFHSMITTSQLTNVIYCLEVLIGIIYLFQFICFFFWFYKSNGQTLFMNLQQRNQYNLEYSQKTVRQQHDNSLPLLNAQNSQNISKFNDFSCSPKYFNNDNQSTFQSTQIPQSYNYAGLQQSEFQANLSNNYSNTSRNLASAFKQKSQQEIQIQPEEFFGKYEKCYSQDNNEEIILGRGSSATVYLYKKKYNNNNLQNNNNNLSLNLNQCNIFQGKQNSQLSISSGSQNGSQNKENLVAVKVVTGGNKGDLDNCLSEVSTVLRIQNYKNIIKIYNYTIIQQQSSFSMYVAMDYGENSLAEEIKKRKIDNNLKKIQNQQNQQKKSQDSSLQCDENFNNQKKENLIEKNNQKSLNKIQKIGNLNGKKDYFESHYLENLAQQLIYTLSDLQQMENITHRDIKPQNILKIRGVYFLADFGEAKRFTVENIIKDPTIRGTVKYLSPELRYNYDILCDEVSDRESICDLKEWDSFKSDVFSLGLTLIEAATLENIIGFNLVEERLKKGLQYLKSMGIYSEWFIQLVTLMVVWESSKRPTFPLLKNYIGEQMGEERI